MRKEMLYELAARMRRAAKGENLTIGFLGGSITQGSLAAKPEKTYAFLVYRWWCENFPQAAFRYVNAGIGGTSSHFGAARVREDVLMYQPDVLVVDFSVNDDADVFFQETYEGVLRSCMNWQSRPALLLLYNVFYDTGESAQGYHEKLADYYNIPSASMRDSVYQRILEGTYTQTELTPDGLHPNDKGHELVASELIRVLELAKELAESEEKISSEKKIPAAMTDNAYEHAVCRNIRNANPVLQGFWADTQEKKGRLDLFKNGWIGRHKGDSLVFEGECSCIAVQYRKTIHKPSPVAELILDGDTENPILLDGNFTEDWGDCLFLQKVLHHGERKKHVAEVRIKEANGNEQTPFYLVSFVCA